MSNPIQITLDPEHEKFVDAAIRSGRFATADQVVAEALSRLIEDADELDADDLAASEESEAQIARGEGLDWAQVSAALREKYGMR